MIHMYVFMYVFLYVCMYVLASALWTGEDEELRTQQARAPSSAAIQRRRRRNCASKSWTNGRASKVWEKKRERDTRDICVCFWGRSLIKNEGFSKLKCILFRTLFCHAFGEFTQFETLLIAQENVARLKVKESAGDEVSRNILFLCFLV